MTTNETMTHQAEREAIAALRAYVEGRKQLGPLKEAQDYYGGILKTWLEQSLFRALVDQETGTSAVLEERKGQPELDLATMSDAEIISVTRAGLLREVSKAAADAICAHNPRIADIRKKREMPGRPTMALKVQEKPQ